MTSNKPHIGFYCSSISFGGLEMNMVKHAKWLEERGFPITLLVVKDSPLHHFVVQEKVHTITIPRNRKYFDVIKGYQLWKLLQKNDISILWIRDTRDMSIMATVKTLAGKKLTTVYQQAMQLGIVKKDLIHTLRFTKIDIWISLLHVLGNQVKINTRIDPRKIHIIPLGIDTHYLTKNTYTKVEAKEKLYLSKSPVLLGVIGRFDPQKNQLFLIEALYHLKQKGYNLHLALVGESTKNEGDSYEKKLHQKVTELSLEQQVSFIPFTKDIKLIYNALDIFIMPSKAETFGTVTIEAMLSGLPIIGTNTGGTPEVLGFGEFGHLYQPNHIAEFCHAIIPWLESETERIQMGEKAKQEAIQRYSHTVVTQKIEQLLSKETR